MKNYLDIDLNIFPKEREEKLKSIYRFSIFETVFYRSNLWEHTFRVLWLLEALLPIAQKYLKFDLEKARTMALIHDDPEIITGDFQAGHKARMSQEQLQKIDALEKEAIEELSEKFPKEINSYSYKKLLLNVSNKDCIEAKLVSYVDKIDAYCESLHEVLAGNIGVLRSVMFYVGVFAIFPQKFPELKELLSSKEHSLTYLTDILSPEKGWSKRYLHFNKPHTKDSIKMDSDFPFYNTWRKLVITNGGKDGTRYLTEQREFLHQL